MLQVGRQTLSLLCLHRYSSEHARSATWLALLMFTAPAGLAVRLHCSPGGPGRDGGAGRPQVRGDGALHLQALHPVLRQHRAAAQGVLQL